MEAFVKAAPQALWKEKGKQSAAAKFPEFRVWHEVLHPLFGLTPPDWTEKAPPQAVLPLTSAETEEELDLEEADEEESGE